MATETKPLQTAADNENDAVTSPISDDVTKVPVTSPMKRKRRLSSGESKENQEKEVTNAEPSAKRTKLARAQESYPEPFLAPVSWTADAEVDGKAVLVDEEHCIMGTDDGRVVFLNHEGLVRRQVALGYPVGVLFRDSGRLYAWCHAKQGYDTWKGALVDLTFKTPQLLYEVTDFGDLVKYAAMVDSCLALGDNKGNLALVGCDGEVIWKKEQFIGDGGFFTADESGIYFAHKKVVRCYDLKTGEISWEHHVSGGRQVNVQGGTTDGQYIYIEALGKVLQLDKTNGQLVHEFCPFRHAASGVCVGGGYLITGSCPTVVFDVETKEEVYRVNFPCRLAGAASTFDAKRRLFCYWDKLYCVNLDESAIQRAMDGRSTRTFENKVPTKVPELEALNLPAATEVMDAVLLKCFKEGDSANLKVKVTSPGYKDWPVLFPKDLRDESKTFAAMELKESSLGSFYRPAGDIYKYLAVREDTNGEATKPCEKNEDGNESPESDVSDVSHDQDSVLLAPDVDDSRATPAKDEPLNWVYPGKTE